MDRTFCLWCLVWYDFLAGCLGCHIQIKKGECKLKEELKKEEQDYVEQRNVLHMLIDV